MTVYKGIVVNGEIVVDGPPLPEGITVKVFLPEEGESMDFTTEQLDELDAAIATLDRQAENYDELVREKLSALARGAQ